jgi:hypothetical protein
VRGGRELPSKRWELRGWELSPTMATTWPKLIMADNRSTQSPLHLQLYCGGMPIEVYIRAFDACGTPEGERRGMAGSVVCVLPAFRLMSTVPRVAASSAKLGRHYPWVRALCKAVADVHLTADRHTTHVPTAEASTQT